jgi:hypothetical protein
VCCKLEPYFARIFCIPLLCVYAINRRDNTSGTVDADTTDATDAARVDDEPTLAAGVAVVEDVCTAISLSVDDAIVDGDMPESNVNDLVAPVVAVAVAVVALASIGVVAVPIAVVVVVAVVFESVAFVLAVAGEVVPGDAALGHCDATVDVKPSTCTPAPELYMATLSGCI